LKKHIESLKRAYQEALERGGGEATLPTALERRFPGLAGRWEWQYVFPSPRLPKRSSATGKDAPRRHHVHENAVQKAIKAAARLAGLPATPTAQTLRNSFAAHLLQAGHDIHTVQKLLGHADVTTTMIYANLSNRSPTATKGQADD